MREVSILSFAPLPSEMLAPQVKRLRLREYGAWTSLADTARDFGVPSSRFSYYLDRAAGRIYRESGVQKPFEFDRQSFRVIDVAGLIRLTPGAELEVIPKFLSGEDPTWREDFFAIASLARYGHILPAEKLLASS